MEAHIMTQEKIREFADWLALEEKAPATQEKYLRSLQRFAGRQAGRPVDQLAINAWKQELLEAGLAPATINAALSSLNSFFGFCGWHELKAKFVRVQRRLFREPQRELTKGQYTRLLQAAEAQGKRQLALVMQTICATGIRVSELRFVTVEALQAGRAIIHLKGKVREILFPKKLVKKLLQYAGAEKITSGEIFLAEGETAKGHRRSLNRRQIWAEMKKLCRPAGVEPTRVFPHNLRHLFATVYYAATQDIVQLADVLGHSSIETTRIYLLTSGTQHQKLLDKLGFVS